MRTCKTQVTHSDVLKTIFTRSKFISELCEDFGEPDGVSKYLNKIAQKSIFLKLILKRDIEKYENEANRWANEAYEAYVASRN